MASTLVIYNPTAGRGRVLTQWPEVEKAFHAANLDFDAYATRAPLEAVTIAKQAVEKYKVVIGVGGDGTIHEIVNGLVQASGEGETIPLGIIPLGNGDDFVKVLPPEAPIGGQPFDWHLAVDKIAGGQTQLFDVGRMRGDHPRYEAEGSAHYFANGMDVGFGAHAARNFTTIPRALKGFSAYLAAIFKTMVNYPIIRLKIKLDDQPVFEQTTTMTAITNGRCFANGFWVCPEASPNDGLLDLMVADGVDRLTILRMIPKIQTGTHLHEPVIKMYKAHQVEIDTDEPLLVEADGEIPYLETHHLKIDLLPRKLQVIV